MQSTIVRPEPRPATGALAEVVGADLEWPVVPHGHKRHIHLDVAASAPALKVVADAVAEFLPWYASVHRGSGHASTVSGEALATARQEIAEFVGGRPDDVVVITRNTTDSLNLLSRSLPAGTAVVTLDAEHHANLLPWRIGSVTHLPTPTSVAEVPARFDEALRQLDAPQALIAVTGASNVTGELLPLAQIAAVAHRHGARLAVDAAQLAPHRAIDMAGAGIDYLALSGHKLYAPYGAGALVGRRDWLDAAPPHLAGGGAVQAVTVDDVAWLAAPARHEGGTPNLLGAVALGAACAALRGIGFGEIAAHDASLTGQLMARVDELGGSAQVLAAFEDAERVGIVALALDRPTALIAAALSAEHAVAVRDGAFCAHPFMRRLAGVATNAPAPSALRLSVGLGTTAADIDLAIDALGSLLHDGPTARYELVDGRLVPSINQKL